MFYIKVIVIANFLFVCFISAFILIHKFGSSSKYFRLFWNDSLVLLDFKIDNPQSYLMVMLPLVVLSMFEVFRDTYIDPWLYNVIYDPNVKDVQEATISTVYIITIMDSICEMITRFIGFSSAFIQLDFFLISMITVIITLTFVIRTYTKDKVFYSYPNGYFFKIRYIFGSLKGAFEKKSQDMTKLMEDDDTQTVDDNFDVVVN